MTNLVEQLRQDVLQARKHKDQATTEAIQNVLARISNAEAVSLGDTQKYQQHVGVGSSEVARKELTEADIRALLQEEIDDMHHAIGEMEKYPDHPYVLDLQKKATILEKYL